MSSNDPRGCRWLYTTPHLIRLLAVSHHKNLDTQTKKR
nr:MAG TPA: hypothetical protein [Caudoviricetes sp.]